LEGLGRLEFSKNIWKGEMIMIIEACTLRNDEVKTIDGKQLGRVVNIIFDSDSKSPPA
jgi:hypothetical protein